MKIAHALMALTLVGGGRAVAAPVWFDLTVSDLPRAEGFYRSVLGWRFAPEQTQYAVIEADGSPIGGFYHQEGAAGGGGASVYFRVKDLEGALARAKEHGATILFGPTALPDGGVMALFQDPDGNHVGLMH